MPSPVKPALQVHVRPPGPFENGAARTPQGWLFRQGFHALVKNLQCGIWISLFFGRGRAGFIHLPYTTTFDDAVRTRWGHALEAIVAAAIR